MSDKKWANVKHVNSMCLWEVTMSARLGLKEGVIVHRGDQSWSFGHRDALRLTHRHFGPIKPLRQVV